MKKVLFAGCSFTSGYGWDSTNPYADNTNAPELWVNLCHKNIKKLNQLELVNIGKPGSTNTDIFTEVIKNLTIHTSDVDTVFVQWTSMPRYNVGIGLELWDTSEQIATLTTNTHDINLSDGTTISRKYIQDLLDRLLVLHHPHWDILNLINYTNIIKNLGNVLGIPHIFFINGICPWDNDYFTILKDATPESYTPYTKKTILNIDSRSDEDIFKLYNLIHTQYNDAGGVHPNNWINLYNSFSNYHVDYNFDKLHPGTKSNQHFFKLVQSGLQNLNYI